jgi:alanine racemase
VLVSLTVAMPRPCLVRIRPLALRDNLARVRSVAPGCRVWAVVKADAYGHGLLPAMAGLADADGLALVEFDQAARLRAAGWRRPVLMLEGAFEEADVAQAARLGLSLVVHEPRQLDWLARAPAGTGLPVFLKMNSGMNRLGFEPAAFTMAAARLATAPAVGPITWMTHFARADEPGGAEEPWWRFRDALPAGDASLSLANSAALIDFPPARTGWVRPGIMLYGASPFADRPAAGLGLRPAMVFESRLISVQTLHAGDAVGYGGAFVAERPMRLGIVACGYADGYPRHAPTGTPIAVAGVRTRVVGRVSMDMLTVDLGGVAHAQTGDAVELWGDRVPIDEVAAAAGTIAYELMCAIAPRVARVVEDPVA